MPAQGDSSKTIALLVAIIAVTVALLGAEAWNRAQKNKPATVTPASVTAPAPAQPEQGAKRGARGNDANGPDKGTRNAQGEVQFNM